ncbi:hypothetical protein HDU89_008271 [Geranomyces variabilis]|nr:hypothetical protein HDU89_008271 [Geranomyces variabilis]
MYPGIIDITRQDPLLEKLFTTAEWKEYGDDFRSIAQLTLVDDSLIDSLKQIKDSVEGQHAANIIRLKPIAWEAVMDNATTAHLMRTLIDPMQKRWLVAEGELQSIGSKVARDHDISSTERAAAARSPGVPALRRSAESTQEED